MTQGSDSRQWHDGTVRIKNPDGSYTHGWLRFQVYFWGCIWLLVLAGLILSVVEGNGQGILGFVVALILGGLGIALTYKEWRRALPPNR
jgi:hypothetical protein